MLRITSRRTATFCFHVGQLTDKGFGNVNGEEIYNKNLKIMLHPNIIGTVLNPPPPAHKGFVYFTPHVLQTMV
jgi:hypothetical protein